MRDSRELGRAITRRSSLHTYLIIHFLGDHERRDDAFRAYAYFRWVDDWLDTPARHPSGRMEFINRQQRLIKSCFEGRPPGNVCPEEKVLVDLVHNHPNPAGPVAVYARDMMAVMAFDAQRRGRLISQAELNGYQNSLAMAVTEAMHYFIGCARPAPHTPDRYRAVMGAHIAHMLRDTLEDIAVGYINISAEALNAHGIGPLDYDSVPYRDWVRLRVEQAREHLAAGLQYLRHVPSARCRLAARLYTARFTKVLDRIERDGFRLGVGDHPTSQVSPELNSSRRSRSPSWQ